MDETFLLEDLIPNRTGKPWTAASWKKEYNKVKWSKNINSKLKTPLASTPPLKICDVGDENMFSLESETSITFLNKDRYPFVYQPKEIITVYRHSKKCTAGGTVGVDIEADYKPFVEAILKIAGGETSVADRILTDLSDLNKKFVEVEGEEAYYKRYYEHLKQKLLEIIEGVEDINVVITILPKNDDIDKEFSILVGSNFKEEKETIGLNIYSKKYYERGDQGETEQLEINLLTLLEQTSKTPWLSLGFNLKKLNNTLNEYIVHAVVAPDVIEEKNGGVVSDKSTKKPDTISKRIELCNGDKIDDNYFLDWVKIEIDQIKNKKFNTFLVEPLQSGQRNRKLLSYSKDTNKPSRFAGYFRKLEDSECEIIWEPGWEVRYIDDGDEQDIVPRDTILPSASEPTKIHTSRHDELSKLTKLMRFESEISIKLGSSYKMYNLEAEQGNCFFYSFANSLIDLDIIDFKADYPDLIAPDKFVKIQRENRVRPLYKELSDKLRILAHDILKKSFDALNIRVKRKIDEGEFDGVTYPFYADDVPERKEVLQELLVQRLSIVGSEVDDLLVGHERETAIKDSADTYLQKLKSNHFLGSNLEFEVLCAFFNVNGEILTLSNESQLVRVPINKTKAILKFSLDGVQLDSRVDTLSLEDSSDKTIYLSLIDRHFMSTIPWGSFSKTSYNYLFQNNELEVSINYPKGTYNKMKVADFHAGSTSSPTVDNTFLEECHNYIQWLFPNMKVSEQVQSSQKYIYWNNKKRYEVPNQLILTSDDVKFITAVDGDKAKLNSIKSLITIMKFFGFRFIIDGAGGGEALEITNYENFEKQLKNIKLERLSDVDEYKERFANLLSKSHNYSRITRILKYLNAIGLSKLSKIIVHKLKYEIEDPAGELRDNSGIKRSLTTFWINTI